MKESPRAVFAGSFDPITLGHMGLIRRARALFPLLVAVGHNEKKRYLFDAEKRLAMVRGAVDWEDVEVARFDGLLVDFARARGCTVLVRGLRDVSDFAFEQQSARVNQALAADIETVWLPADPATAHLSSSMVREIQANGGDATPYVPSVVADVLRGL